MSVELSKHIKDNFKERGLILVDIRPTDNWDDDSVGFREIKKYNDYKLPKFTWKAFWSNFK